MDDYCSPQWVDFTSISEQPSDNYFEKNHEIEKYKECNEIPQITITSEDEVNIKEMCEKRNMDHVLETELNIIRNTPIKVIYSSSSRRSNKCEVVKKVTYDDVIKEVIDTFERCVPSQTGVFKNPTSIQNKISTSIKPLTMDNNQENVSPNKEIKEIKYSIPDQEVKSSSSINPFNSNTVPNNLLQNNESELKLVSILNEQRQCNSSGKKSTDRRSRPLTYQCRRQSLKFRRHSSQYISLAASVLKFQNETPERFRTKNNKDSKISIASAKKKSSVTRKSILSKSYIQRKSVSVLYKNEEKESKPDVMNKLPIDKVNPKHVVETPNTIKSKPYFISSSKKVCDGKNVVSTIVENNDSEIVLKKQEILFFGVPVSTNKKKTTRPIPFNFENREKAKKQSKSEQVDLQNNKSGNVVKLQNIQSKISCSQKKINAYSSNVKNKTARLINTKNNHSKVLETNGEACTSVVTNNTLENNSHEKRTNNEKNIATTCQNVKGAIKRNPSVSISSLKPLEKTGDQTRKNEHTHNKGAKQLKNKSMSMSFKNSHDKNVDINKAKNTESNTQTQDINQVKKQSSLLLCKNKNIIGSKKIESIQTMEDPSKIKSVCPTSNRNSTNTNIQGKRIIKERQQCIEQQENKEPNVNASTMGDNNLIQAGNMKPKSITIGMNSYNRGKKRHEYDEKVKQKNMMEEEMRQKKEAERSIKEKLQITTLRKQIETKAKPMPVFKPLFPIKSIKPLTEPQSPAWAYKYKAKKTE